MVTRCVSTTELEVETGDIALHHKHFIEYEDGTEEEEVRAYTCFESSGLEIVKPPGSHHPCPAARASSGSAACRRIVIHRACLLAREFGSRCRLHPKRLWQVTFPDATLVISGVKPEGEPATSSKKGKSSAK